VSAVLNSAQAVVAAYRYDPFGKLLATSDTFVQPFQFSTKRYDAQTGLLHYQFRAYAPTLARWLTRDPLGEAGGINLYAFVGNNPVNGIDPYGLLTEVIITGGTWYGHAALRINGQVYSVGRYNPKSAYSSGTKGDNIFVIQSYKSYVANYQNHHRNSTGYVLDIAPTDEQKIQQFFNDLKKSGTKTKIGYKLPKDYAFITNNCTTIVVNGLNQGLSTFDNLWIEAFSPYQLEFHLMIAPWLVDKVVDYPAK
jgi:RHS repeat-associated protein